MVKPVNIDEYIARFPEETRVLLEQVRATIREAAPQAEEVISYAMPAFRLNGILVWFAAYKNHIGLYPAPSAIAAFKEDLSGYKSGKGSIHLPIDKPLPLGLIAEIVKLRIAANSNK